MIYALVASLFAATALAQCPTPTVERDTFQAEILSTSGLSILNENTLLTLDLSFSRGYDLDSLYFKECVDANGDPVPFTAYSTTNDAGAPQATNMNTEVVDPNNSCQKLVTASIDYLEYCNFNVEDSADGSTTTFSGELTLNTEISFTSPFAFTREVQRPMLFFITFDRTFSVTTNIEVFNPNQCEDSTDCNGFPCVMFPTEGIKKCNCTNEYGSNQGQHCETDATCPTFTDCPDGTVTVVPLVTALPGLLSQVLSNAPSYNDNQLTGNIYATRSINGVSITTSPTGTDDLLSYEFPLGVTGVTYTAKDETGNECECNFQVNVTDALAPVVDCPPDLITNVWNSWAEPTGSDLIDNNVHFWVVITGSNGNSQTITTTEAPTTTTTTTTTNQAPAGITDCNSAYCIGYPSVWSDYSSYDSYFLDTTAGDFDRVSASVYDCPTPYTASDFPSTSQVATWMVDTTPNVHTYWAFKNTMTFKQGSFGNPDTPVAQGIYCPTVDPDFWYNAAEDTFIWANEGTWSIGKPSVFWLASAQVDTTCFTYGGPLC
jgi:hypothetical protein